MNTERNPAEISIRPATLADVDRLLAIEALCFDKERYGNGQSRRSFRSAVTAPTARLAVAQYRGQVTGYSLLFFRRVGPSARFYSLAVDPAFQDLGAGRVLFEDVIGSLADIGKPRLILEIREDNDRLFRRYTQRGFKQFSRVPDYYPDGTAAVRMHQTFELAGSKS